jgi:hypothetical protein
VTTSLAITKQASLYSTNKLARENLAPATFRQYVLKYQSFQNDLHTSTASNSIDMDPFLLQTIGSFSDYDTVNFGGDLVCEEDENT